MLGQKLLKIITCGLYKGMKKKEDNYFSKLVKENNNVSALNFFLLSTLFVGIILLIVPIVGMLVDIFFNHTMTINLSDMALYIGAVAGIFASGGLTSAWTEFSYSKFKVAPLDENGRPIKDDNHNGIPDDQEDDIDTEEELVCE